MTGRALRLRELSVQAYWAAETPKEAKMAGILLDLFAPDVSAAAEGVELDRDGVSGVNLGRSATV